jgi:hypothetical protein
MNDLNRGLDQNYNSVQPDTSQIDWTAGEIEQMNRMIENSE